MFEHLDVKESPEAPRPIKPIDDDILYFEIKHGTQPSSKLGLYSIPSFFARWQHGTVQCVCLSSCGVSQCEQSTSSTSGFWQPTQWRQLIRCISLQILNCVGVPIIVAMRPFYNSSSESGLVPLSSSQGSLKKLRAINNSFMISNSQIDIPYTYSILISYWRIL